MQEEASRIEQNDNIIEESETEQKNATEEETPVPHGSEEPPLPAKRGRKKKTSIPTVASVLSKEAEREESGSGVQADVPQKPRISQKSEELPPESTQPVEEKSAEPKKELNLDSESALLETVLFLESEPQTVESLAKITQFAEDVVKECIERLTEKYANEDSGIELVQIIGGWLLTPKKECFDLVKERYGKKNEGRLSKAAIETLAIIAHSQPITRAEIKSFRGVDPDNMLHILLERKFITEVGKKDVPGKPTLYGTTKEFLEFFHLQSISDLPQPDEQEERDRFELAR